MRILTLQYRGAVAGTYRFVDDDLAERAFNADRGAILRGEGAEIRGEGGSHTVIAPGTLMAASLEDPELVTPPMLEFTKRMRRIERAASRDVDEADENDRRLRGEVAGIA